MRRLLALVPFLALAACSTASNDDVASNDEALVTDSMCATLDYGPRGPAADVYDFFATTEDAANFMRQVEATGYFKRVGGSTATFREISSDPRVTKLVGDAFEGMRRVFPRETADLPTAPPVAIVDTPVRNAFVLPGGAFGPKAPWVFVIHSGILGSDDDELMAVIAHELGHLILRNYAREVRPLINAAYLVDATGENAIFGAKQANDPVLAQRVNDVQARERRVGLLPELGFGTPGSGFSNGLQSLYPADGAAEVTVDACKNVKTALTALQQAQFPFFKEAFSGGPAPRQPNATELANLEALSNAAVAELHTCFATVTDTKTIRDLYVQEGVPESVIDAVLLQAEKDVDANASLPGVGERLLTAEAAVRADVVALRADPAAPFARIRMYDVEEDSDDASVRVMLAMGRDPTANGRFLLDSTSADAKAACLTAVAAGTPIDFGEIRDVHPAHCWRYYHQVQLAKSLSTTCAPIPTRTRKPSGGNASVTPVDPLDFIGKSYGSSR